MRLNRFQRYQTFLSVQDLYPPLTDEQGERLCPCGCGGKPQTRRHKWATAECLRAVLVRFKVLKGDGATIRRLLWKRDGGVCRGCGVVCWGGKPTTREHGAAQDKERHAWRSQGLPWRPEHWQADHIIPVEQGGGACELDGFQTLCVRCHRQKSNVEASGRTATPAHATP